MHPLLLHVCVCYRSGHVQMCRSSASGRKSWESNTTLPKLSNSFGPNERAEVRAYKHTCTVTWYRWMPGLRLTGNTIPLILNILLWQTAAPDRQAQCQHTLTLIHIQVTVHRCQPMQYYVFYEYKYMHTVLLVQTYSFRHTLTYIHTVWTAVIQFSSQWGFEIKAEVRIVRAVTHRKNEGSEREKVEAWE